ncbi:PIN domain-like protein [Mycena latifolia]|nr:PIN domain-like protein [Mycena latifolia]
MRCWVIIASGQAHANIFGLGGQTLILEKLFYQLCNLSLAPLTPIFVFDGPGRPSVKRGTKVIFRPTWLIEHLKKMLINFGFHFYDVSLNKFTFYSLLKAEAELGQLNEHGRIDAILTEDSNTFLFGAKCVIRTLGFELNNSLCIRHLLIFAMDKDGLFLYALLLGGDYDSGISGAGSTIAHALAKQGFGHKLVNILRSSKGPEVPLLLSAWRDSIRQELRTNSSGLLAKRQPKLADQIPDTFPNLDVAHLYLDPRTSECRVQNGLFSKRGSSFNMSF